MKQFLYGAALSALMTAGAHAENIGVTMAAFDDNFLTMLRNAMQEHVEAMPGVSLQVEDATQDVGKQQSQIQNFLASGVDAIIANPVDTDATAVMTKIVEAAGIPLVYINRMPINIDTLPATQSYVGSDEAEAGRLQATEVCRLLREAGKTEASIVIMMGELSTQSARTRTGAVHDVVATPECSFIKIVEEQTANYQRTQGADLVSNWLSAGLKFDAVVANNDEMAIGAAQALKAAGVDMGDVVIAGIDATSDALAAMTAGDLDVTVFQNAEAQGQAAVETAVRLVRGETVERQVLVPFELVTPDNMADYQN